MSNIVKLITKPRQEMNITELLHNLLYKEPTKHQVIHYDFKLKELCAIETRTW